jgi:hypothetical protein
LSARRVAWLVIEPGWQVVARDGKPVGRVEEIVGDTGNDIFNGLVIATGFFKAKYVPSEQVADIREGEVRLDVGADEIDRLGDHEQPPPSAQFRAD